MKDKSQTIAAQPAASEEESEVVEPGKKRLNELGEKPIGRLLLQYALPAITAMAASSLYNIIDGIFIGQGVGPEAIMGLALTGPLMALGAAFGAMVGVGGATLMSVRLGQKDYRTAQDILGNVLFMNVVMGLGLGILLQVFLTPILRFFGASDVTLGPARFYDRNPLRQRHYSPLFGYECLASLDQSASRGYAFNNWYGRGQLFACTTLYFRLPLGDTRRGGSHRLRTILNALPPILFVYRQNQLGPSAI